MTTCVEKFRSCWGSIFIKMLGWGVVVPLGEKKRTFVTQKILYGVMTCSSLKPQIFPILRQIFAVWKWVRPFWSCPRVCHDLLLFLLGITAGFSCCSWISLGNDFILLPLVPWYSPSWSFQWVWLKNLAYIYNSEIFLVLRIQPTSLQLFFSTWFSVFPHSGEKEKVFKGIKDFNESL